MAVLRGNGVILSSSQTGTGDSTNTHDRGNRVGKPGGVVITSVVGATPTVTVNILGSVDGVNFFNIQYATQGTPQTLVITAITITSATTTTYLFPPDAAWRYLKLAYSSNTNVTLTATSFL